MAVKLERIAFARGGYGYRAASQDTHSSLENI